VADRTWCIERRAALACISHQFLLCVTHFAARRLTGEECLNRSFARQAIVDRPANTVGSSLCETLFHGPKGTEHLGSITAGPPATPRVRLWVMTWRRYTTAGKAGGERPIDSIELGPGDVRGLGRRLLGDVSGRRILELGTGRGNTAIAMAAAGARVVAIDPNAKELAKARIAVEAAEVAVELHEAESFELAFLHAEIFDVVVAVHSLAAAPDLGRVFRQVHRVLKPDRPLVFTLPHPLSLMTDPDDQSLITGDYAESGHVGRGMHVTYRHTISEVFTLLTRSNFHVDTLLEPAGVGPFPASIVFRGRKLGT